MRVGVEARVGVEIRVPFAIIGISCGMMMGEEGTGQRAEGRWRDRRGGCTKGGMSGWEGAD